LSTADVLVVATEYAKGLAPLRWRRCVTVLRTLAMCSAAEKAAYPPRSERWGQFFMSG
jgi:hypothetical protein